MFIFKNTSTPNAIESNPIWSEFEVRSYTPAATAGPEHAWRIFDAYRKSDQQVRHQGECKISLIVQKNKKKCMK